jgi:hypothetical protein
VLNCTGGSVVSGNTCVCPNGYSWIDNRCQINCIEGAHRVDDNNCACPAGAVSDGNRCVCPNGTFWDEPNNQCSTLNCVGGAYASGNQCVCPDGYSWIDERCQINCISGANRINDNTCECPGGSLPMNGQCECPAGTNWNGAQCIYPPAQPQPYQPPPEEHHPRREYREEHREVSGSKTLTINGCTYTDSATGALGRSCGHREGCPGGYVCDIIGGSSGFCVPANQRCRH